MQYSVEWSPYLDRELAEFVGEHLIRDGRTKSLLREAVDGVLNEQVRLDKQKRGFNASIDSMLDRDDAAVTERLLAPGPIFDVVDRQKIENFMGGDMTDNSFSKFAFSFVSAKLPEVAANRIDAPLN